MSLLLGCIADDFTGGTDLAGMLVKHGMRTVQVIGVPTGPVPSDVDAIVIALKSRTTPAADAVAESLAALRWLRSAACRQFYFKYCSTFDSTPKGNIGPVAEALMAELGVDFAIACPAFPENRRTIYKGHLFVGDVLLSESGMRHHPLTPMIDSNLVRVLQAQVQGQVGLVEHSVVSQGAAAIAQQFASLRAEGVRLAVVDALTNDDLVQLGAACADHQLLTAGSGVALGLPANFKGKGLLKKSSVASRLPQAQGAAAVIAGSCSEATNGQVALMRESHPAFVIEAKALAQDDDLVGRALAWAKDKLASGPVLIYATANPAEVKVVQAELGAERAGALVEAALARIARGLVELGVGRLIVAGGETSGAVVKALGVKALRIGPEIDPGVPWTCALGAGRPLMLALKSGNFGSKDFFMKAWGHLDHDEHVAVGA